MSEIQIDYSDADRQAWMVGVLRLESAILGYVREEVMQDPFLTLEDLQELYHQSVSSMQTSTPATSLGATAAWHMVRTKLFTMKGLHEINLTPKIMHQIKLICVAIIAVGPGTSGQRIASFIEATEQLH